MDRMAGTRTTLTIDDDVLAAARQLARDEEGPLREVLSDLARRSLSPAPPPPAFRNGLVLFARGAGHPPGTADLVAELQDDPAP
jgi:hypothetical protein